MQLCTIEVKWYCLAEKTFPVVSSIHFPYELLNSIESIAWLVPIKEKEKSIGWAELPFFLCMHLVLYSFFFFFLCKI
jgi:hypothetical protein